MGEVPRLSSENGAAYNQHIEAGKDHAGLPSRTDSVLPLYLLVTSLVLITLAGFRAADVLQWPIWH